MTALNRHIGEYLNIEQDLLLQTALYLLKKENNLKSIQFWGKISGMQNDYYIICGRGDDYFKNMKLFYSHQENLVKTKLLKEEDRLASTIDMINEEVAIIPTGAFYLDVDGKTVENSAFKESWQLQLTSGGKVADLYSLMWPGFKLSLCPNTPHYTQFYFGDGRKNYDLYFMV
ncbi:hypothetical protein B566_EDAN005233 [Ephemera danica]|nr:hypothetical protein B566_EDAN005233 [Ephemera danica]